MEKRKPWNVGLTKKTDERLNRAGIKISKSRKGKCLGRRNPAKRIEVRKKISTALKYRVLTEEWKRKISNTLTGKKLSEQTKQKISNSLNGHIGYWTGRQMSDEHTQKQREAAFNYIRNAKGLIGPRIGKNEKKLLDSLENEIGYAIDRKFIVEGYFPDGYIHELNLIVEVDERPKNKEKDIKRENIIKHALGCEFLRIKDYA